MHERAGGNEAFASYFEEGFFEDEKRELAGYREGGVVLCWSEGRGVGFTGVGAEVAAFVFAKGHELLDGKVGASKGFLDRGGNGGSDMGELEEGRGVWGDGLNEMLGYPVGGEEGARVPVGERDGDEGFVQV